MRKFWIIVSIAYFLANPVSIVDRKVYEEISPIEPIKAVKVETEKPLTEVKPAVSKAPVAAPSAGTVAYSGSLADWLYKLRMCESGGNYQINTGNGYYGAYQFLDSTWDHWQTGYARADLAPPSVQDATIIKNTNASSGGLASQNPGCYAKMGLSAFPPS